MRTPLAAIRGFVDTLRRRRHTMDDEQVDEFLEVIATQTDRLIRLVDDLLVLAGLEAGGIVRRRPSRCSWCRSSSPSPGSSPVARIACA